jgi:hypothetical protein
MAIDAGTATLITAYVLTALAFMIILSRIILRYLKNESFKPDDWVMLASIPVYFVNTACYQVIIPNGSNLVSHPEFLTQDEIDARKENPRRSSPQLKLTVSEGVLGSKFALLGRPCEHISIDYPSRFNNSLF